MSGYFIQAIILNNIKIIKIQSSFRLTLLRSINSNTYFIIKVPTIDKNRNSPKSFTKSIDKIPDVKTIAM